MIQNFDEYYQTNESVDVNEAYDLCENGYEFLREITSILKKYGISYIKSSNFQIGFKKSNVVCNYEITSSSFSATKTTENGRNLGVEAMCTYEEKY